MRERERERERRKELSSAECKEEKIKTEERYLFGGSYIMPTRFDFKFLSEYKNILLKYLPFIYIYIYIYKLKQNYPIIKLTDEIN